MADRRKLPIDIQYKQLLEALVDRRVVPAKWQEQHRQLREAVAVLYPALPLASDELAKMRARTPGHEDVHYFDCKRVLAALAASDEGSGKNFFGQYTSPVLRQWGALVRQYEKNNVFAAEAARIIAQNTAFEVPFLKKAMQQNDKQVADNKSKIQDLHRSIAEYKRKLEASCAEMGIPGDNFRAELQRLPLELPSIFQAVGESICAGEVLHAIEYHEVLQTYLHSCEPPVMETAADEGTASSKGKSKKKTKTGKAQSESPRATEEAFELVSAPYKFFTALKELHEAEDKLDEPSPVSLDFEAEATEISWDITLDDAGTADAVADAGAIDWGIETVVEQDGGGSAGSDDTPVEIDWDITTSEVTAVEGEEGAHEVTLDVSESEIGAKPATRVGLLSAADFRTRLLNDLMELRAFLRQRQVELADGDNVAFANQFQGSSPLLEQQSTETVKRLQVAVDGAIAELTSKRLQQLVLLQTSDRYLDRHVASLEMLTKQVDKSRREIASLEDKNAELIDATGKLQPQIDSLVAATKRLKRDLEAALPPLFKGYKVNIIGDVNSL